MFRHSPLLTLLTLSLLCGGELFSQAPPGITLIDSADAVHNFGIIAEERGSVSHTFVLKNSSTQPMVILRVNTDCGCTTPSYDRTAVMPGDSVPIVIAFDPMGRPGSFVKYARVYTSVTPEQPVRLTIKGNVTTLGRPMGSNYLYQQQIGSLLVSNVRLDFPLQPADAENTIRLMLNNPTALPIRVSLDPIPAFLSISKTHMTLSAQEPEELYLTAKPYEEVGPGIWSGWIGISAQTGEERESTSGGVMVRLVMPPRFDKKAETHPRAELRTYYLVTDMSDEASEYAGEAEITNRGDAPLRLYSVVSNHPALTIASYPSEIAPGASGTVSYRIVRDTPSRQGEKQQKADFDLLMNDPDAPLRNVLIMLSQKQQ